MGRRPLSKIRRKEFARAAHLCLAQHGLAGTTLARVAEQAGVSKASVLHYYRTKEDLLEAALRHGNSTLRDEVSALMRVARDPWQRVYAVIEANLSPRAFRPPIAQGWLALSAAVPHNRQYQRIQTVIYARTRSNLVGPLRSLSDAETAELMTDALISVIDGVWTRCGLSLGGMTAAEARRQFELLLDARFADSPERHAARRLMSEACRAQMLARGIPCED
ncbi:transcriptional regulator BetI [Pseudooceanicola sp. CBS1P-1]|uniref:Transcriptional regulator BetI n=1 Tax=Pseudooceanicola albus TaxID=2692189 RepID=A0A6L7G952_9RHOB|nr:MULTISPECIES: transcriptional regulator BetI [Pseudooceanicola]MBT9386344.1 transcriptional regulator BetI [Pseudooceanicola endophyticus]MXN20499.1 transcriptional regulator BetI [Pseudooceanicola albus]